MNYVVVDLEATCWEKDTTPDRMEIIEIGAVYLHAADLTSRDDFECFVKPIHEPQLSQFCRELTSIAQSDVDTAEEFPAALASFLAWLGTEPVIMCSWGYYDWRQLQVDCRRHAISFPDALQEHINLKLEFARLHGGKAVGMKRALRRSQLNLEGTHHRGIDDAHNIAKLARIILPRLDRSDTGTDEPNRN